MLDLYNLDKIFRLNRSAAKLILFSDMVLETGFIGKKSRQNKISDDHVEQILFNCNNLENSYSKFKLEMLFRDQKSYND